MKFEATETNRKFAKDSINVQDACNMTGVLGALIRGMEAVKEESPDNYAHHPAVILFTDKILDLARRPSLTAEPAQGDDPIVLLTELRDKLCDLRTSEHLGGDEINQHSLVEQYMKRFAELVGYDGSDIFQFGRCWDACQALEKSESVVMADTHN